MSGPGGRVLSVQQRRQRAPGGARVGLAPAGAGAEQRPVACGDGEPREVRRDEPLAEVPALARLVERALEARRQARRRGVHRVGGRELPASELAGGVDEQAAPRAVAARVRDPVSFVPVASSRGTGGPLT